MLANAISNKDVSFSSGDIEAFMALSVTRETDGVMAKKEFNEKIAGEVIHSLGGSLDEMISSGMIENMMIDEE